jgi:hypothetical protein
MQPREAFTFSTETDSTVIPEEEMAVATEHIQRGEVLWSSNSPGELQFVEHVIPSQSSRGIIESTSENLDGSPSRSRPSLYDGMAIGEWRRLTPAAAQRARTHFQVTEVYAEQREPMIMSQGELQAIYAKSARAFGSAGFKIGQQITVETNDGEGDQPLQETWLIKEFGGYARFMEEGNHYTSTLTLTAIDPHNPERSIPNIPFEEIERLNPKGSSRAPIGVILRNTIRRVGEAAARM